MPCMCGDIYCSSCGPAQGNSKCHICGRWTEDGGCEKPEVCNEQARKQAEAEYEYDLKMEEEMRIYGNQFLRRS
jgi:hypothetical protein